MTPLMPKARRRRTAFTLVELLVVLAIVAVLLSLLMAAVQRAREAGRRTQAHTEIREFGQGIGFFKEKYKVDYIPSRIVLRERMDYNLDQVTAPLEVASLTWLKQAWPNIPAPQLSGVSPYPIGSVPVTNGIDWNGDGVISPNPVTLEGDQCLVFFLGGIPVNGQPDGFSTNSRNPAAAGGKRIGPYAQFQFDRLSARTNAAGNAGFRSYIDPWKAQPYAYFTSYGKEKLLNAYVAADCPLGVAPYAEPSTSKYLNADGFQIISAGSDKAFGAGGTNLPATGTGEDDIANFSKAVLGSGIQ